MRLTALLVDETRLAQEQVDCWRVPRLLVGVVGVEGEEVSPVEYRTGQ